MELETRDVNPQLKWDLAPLLLRIPIGLTMAIHGYDKVFVNGAEKLVGMTGSLPWPWHLNPDLSAYMLAYGEFLLGLMLLFGLFARFAAAGVMVIMFVAITSAHWHWTGSSFADLFDPSVWKAFYIGDKAANPRSGIEWQALIFMGSASLLFSGGGLVSLECAIFGKKFTDRSWIWAIWSALSNKLLGPVMISIAMGVVYFVVLLPFQFVRLKNPLRKALKPGPYWETRKPTEHSLDRMAKRF